MSKRIDKGMHSEWIICPNLYPLNPCASSWGVWINRWAKPPTKCPTICSPRSLTKNYLKQIPLFKDDQNSVLYRTKHDCKSKYLQVGLYGNLNTALHQRTIREWKVSFRAELEKTFAILPMDKDILSNRMGCLSFSRTNSRTIPSPPRTYKWPMKIHKGRQPH